MKNANFSETYRKIFSLIPAETRAFARKKRINQQILPIDAQKLPFRGIKACRC